MIFVQGPRVPSYATGYSDYNIWPYDLEHVLRVALGSGIIFTKFDFRQLIRDRIIAFLCWYVTSRCDLDLWPLDIELLQHFECHEFKYTVSKTSQTFLAVTRESIVGFSKYLAFLAYMLHLTSGVFKGGTRVSVPPSRCRKKMCPSCY